VCGETSINSRYDFELERFEGVKKGGRHRPQAAGEVNLLMLSARVQGLAGRGGHCPVKLKSKEKRGKKCQRNVSARSFVLLDLAS
jgi:hypothetical protein